MYTGATGSNLARPTSSGEDRSSATAACSSGFPVLATANLRLRAFELSDISQLKAIANEHHVADTTIDVPHPFTAAYARQWVESHAGLWERRRSVHWAVSLLADDRLVGYTGLEHIDLLNRQAELSFWIGRGMECRGYATEAAQAALAFAFSTLEMNRVGAFHLARDIVAARILSKIGMQQEGLLRQRVCKWDQFEDVCVSGMLKSEWLASL